jgi:hypothetical protein
MTRRYTGGFLSATEQATDANTANGIYTLQEAGQATAVGNFPIGRWTPQRSLRLRRSANAYLNRTPAAASNRKTWTWSAWVKRGLVDQNATLFAARTSSGATYLTFVLSSAGDFRMESNSETAYPLYKTNALFRDPAAWYHIVVALDMTQATSTNRLKVYVNGALQSTASYNVPAQNTDLAVNSTETHLIGQQASGNYADAYITEYNLIDGQALTPSSFGFTDPETGTWVPKRYTGTYGTNGCYLDFRDNSAATATTLGADRSGNGNNFTPNNISISGATNDSMVDVPGIASVSNQPDIGGVTRGNYCTLNQIHRQYATTDSTGSVQPSEEWADGNLRVFWKHDGVSGVVSGTMAMPNTGKWYFEYTNVYEPANAPVRYGQWVGLLPADSAPAIGGTYAGGLNGSGYAYSSEGALYRSAFGGTDSGVDSFATYGTGDVIGIAYDGDNRKISWYKNNTLIVTESNISLTPTGWLPSAGGIKQNTGSGWNTSNIPGQGLFNFGATPFIYTPPAGFKSICTTNLPNPVIKRPRDHFDVKTWTGTGKAVTVGTVTKQTSSIQTKGLRFRRVTSTSGSTLTKTYSSAPTSRTTYTISAWVKPISTGTNAIAVWGTPGNWESLRWHSDGTIYWCPGSGRTWTTNVRYTPNQWYHVMVAVDTTQSASSNRGKLYINGALVTNYSSQETVTLNAQTVEWGVPISYGGSVIGATGGDGVANAFDGYISEFNYIDGQAKSPTDFGQYDANNNWVPQTYTGTYGTNGSYLPLTPVSLGTSTYGGVFCWIEPIIFTIKCC